MTNLTAGFNSLYPDVKVEYQSFTNYADDIATMMQSDNYGDVVMTPQALKQADLPNFFEPLGTYEELSKKYYWLENYTVDGLVYALPTGGTASGILYNKRVWAEAGITELPSTTDEFMKCLKMIQSVSPDIYEAAELDGANRFQVFKYIIAPSIRPIILLQMILAVKGAISVYEIPFIITGGRFGSSTFVIQTTETAFKFQKVGLASAMAVVLFFIIVIVTIIQKLVFKEEK
ncbi:MAG: extracellular solute-binding protein [Oscillospiraceae bacterium]|nr:extracellular solute-binding protein [Oscillospiraceae bacterium]